MTIVDQLTLRTFNHLLRSESWARDRLRPFAGSVILLEAGLLRLNLQVNEDGMFEVADPTLNADVTLTLPLDNFSRLLFDRESLFASAKLSGSADLAESLGFVFRHLKWDAEGDLAGWVGDIPARRMAMLASRTGKQLGEAFQRTAVNIAEYATEDSRLLTPGREISRFCTGVDELRNDLARLEKRILRL